HLVRKSRTRQIMSWAPVLPALVFLAAIFFGAIADNSLRSISPPEGPWFSYYWKLATDSFYLRSLFETVALSAATTVVCLLIGYPIAYYLVRHARGGRA